MYGLSREVAAVRKDSNSEWREVGGVLRGERREKRRRVVPGGKGVEKSVGRVVPGTECAEEKREGGGQAARVLVKAVCV